MGAVGLAAAVLAARQSSAERWLVVWLLAAVVALGIGLGEHVAQGRPARRAAGRRRRTPLRDEPGRAAGRRRRR